MRPTRGPPFSYGHDMNRGTPENEARPDRDSRRTGETVASCTAVAFKSPDTQGHFLLCQLAARALRKLKEGGVFGSVLGAPADARSISSGVQAFVAQPEASRLYQLAEDVAIGKFTIPIAKTLPLDQIREARREAAEGALKGKLVLTPG